MTLWRLCCNHHLYSHNSDKSVSEGNPGKSTMDLNTLANIAEILSGAGVIASLIFVGYELRQNTLQKRLDNWSRQVDRFSDIYGRASDPVLGDLIARGRDNYHGLTEGEKIPFGHHLEQLCIALEAMLHASDENIIGEGDIIQLFEKHIMYHIGCPGGRAWYSEFQQQRGFPPFITGYINKTLQKNQPQS